MRLCNIEFFDFAYTNNLKKIKMVHHDVIVDPVIDDDYLAPGNNTFVISKTTKVKAWHAVYITGPITYFGIVTAVSSDDTLTTVTAKSFLSIFDSKIRFDTNKQKKTNEKNSQSLEEMLVGYLKQYWFDLRQKDDEQKIETLNIVAGTKSVTKWGFHITPDVEGLHYSLVEFYKTLMVRSLQKYKVVVTAKPNFKTGKIDITVKKVSNHLKIHADGSDVVILTFNVKDMTNDVNKLEIWNAKNFSDVVYYYLYNDGTFGKKDTTSKRITPVVLDVITASGDDDKDDTAAKKLEHYLEAAEEAASNRFDEYEFDNLIELETDYNNTLIKPMSLEIGTQAYIMHNGEQYVSYLTCKKYDAGVTLSFGKIRQELTKKIKMGG